DGRRSGAAGVVNRDPALLASARDAAAPPGPQGRNAGGYRPPAWLRNAHLQSALGSSPWRRRRGALALAATGAETFEHLLDAGDGVRLHGLHSAMPGRPSRGLALLLHGWEGSSESSYMRL